MITAISSNLSSKPTQIGLDWLEQIFKNRLSDVIRDTVDVDPENGDFFHLETNGVEA